MHMNTLNRLPRTRTPSGRRRSAGMSIIELLIGLAIGLFILSGATAMFVTNVTNSRQLLIEARVNQELRSAMDLIARDLRRGAYWGNSLLGTTTTGSTGAAQANPYRSVVVNGSTEITYAYSRDATEDNALTANTEQFGIKLDTTSQAIQMRVGAGYQDLTNTDVVLVPSNGLVITPSVTAIDIRAACAKTCTDTVTTPTCPRVLVRTYNVTLRGTARSDSSITRELKSQVRVRNDETVGICPA
jgi:prepilin peptidase dependent protein B